MNFLFQWGNKIIIAANVLLFFLWLFYSVPRNKKTCPPSVVSRHRRSEIRLLIKLIRRNMQVCGTQFDFTGSRPPPVIVHLTCLQASSRPTSWSGCWLTWPRPSDSTSPTWRCIRPWGTTTTGLRWFNVGGERSLVFGEETMREKAFRLVESVLLHSLSSRVRSKGVVYDVRCSPCDTGLRCMWYISLLYRLL